MERGKWAGCRLATGTPPPALCLWGFLLVRRSGLSPLDTAPQAWASPVHCVQGAMVHGCGITAASCPHGGPAWAGAQSSHLLNAVLAAPCRSPPAGQCRLDRFQLHLEGGCGVRMCVPASKLKEGSETGLVFLTLDNTTTTEAKGSSVLVQGHLD